MRLRFSPVPPINILQKNRHADVRPSHVLGQTLQWISVSASAVSKQILSHRHHDVGHKGRHPSHRRDLIYTTTTRSADILKRILHHCLKSEKSFTIVTLTFFGICFHCFLSPVTPRGRCYNTIHSTYTMNYARAQGE